jgi:hypothetical protein
MNQPNLKVVFCAIGLMASVPLAMALPKDPSAPKILVIAPSTAGSTNASRKLLCITSDGIREIADLSGHVLFGSDDKTAAFLQTPANGPHSGSRLLIINRDTLDVIVDRVVQGLAPMTTKALSAGWLAVQSKESTVYFPEFATNLFAVGEANWTTGAGRTLDLAVAEGSERYEITALYLVPSGIAVGRGPFLAIFDPAAQRPRLAFRASIGPGWQSAASYYAVPGFGLTEASDGRFSRVTRNDFSTLISNPESFPNLETNRIRGWRLGWSIQGKPCLLWGENEDGTETQQQTISRIAIFDLESDTIILRKSLGSAFSPYYLPDRTGSHIYFSDPHHQEIFCLDVATQKLSPFAKLETAGFTWVAAD